ncbi:DNA-binding domain-containing protein [Vogesella oryzae]|uniref:HvfC/BufC N-terminal domain-containing protein n=1 Tax=Vogesella oryzae TaxID=1735285 RepID=UPI001581D2CE|nr:DNA-binding domain-containing protein [Vogesella oryzae]
MTAAGQWQQALLDAIRDPQWQPDPDFPAAGLAVYRNNYRVGLMEWLAQLYPICRQLLGEEFFTALAREFVRVTPSRSGNLHRYGGELAGFIAGFAPCAGLPYLPDVARLEWALHRGYYAADAAPLAAANLAAIDPASWGRLRFGFQPAACVLASNWPLAAIHAWHQPDSARQPVDMQQPQPLLLYRDSVGDMQLTVLEYAAAAFCHALYQGSTLEQATTAALALDSGFDLQATLLLLLRCGALATVEEAS